jgi:hypothetical protein
MRHILLLIVGLAVLGACSSAQSLGEGQRINWSCANHKQFSLRAAAGAVEVYAGGQTFSLPPTAPHTYSNGDITYTEANNGASLAGAPGGPYEQCRRSGLGGWLPHI